MHEPQPGARSAQLPGQRPEPGRRYVPSNRFVDETGAEVELGKYFNKRPVVLMLAKDQIPAIVLPELELQKVASLPYDLQVFSYAENPSEWGQPFRQAAQALGLDGKRIGVDPRQLRLLEYRFVKDGAPEADFLDASELLASLRLYKDPAEIERMRRAVKVAQDALEAAIPLIKIGMTEKELSAELVTQLLKHGSEPELPFAPIVSGGVPPLALITSRQVYSPRPMPVFFVVENGRNSRVSMKWRLIPRPVSLTENAIAGSPPSLRSTFATRWIASGTAGAPGRPASRRA